MPQYLTLKAHVEERFLQNNEMRTGDARSHEKPLFAEHSCLTVFSGNRVGHSCVTLFWHTLVGHSCGTLLWDTSMGHSCETLLLDTLVAHSGKTLSLNTLQHSCETLLLEILAAHIWSTSQYHCVLQSPYTEPHTTTLYCKSCTY